jgi:translocation and assembly module TamB
MMRRRKLVFLLIPLSLLLLLAVLLHSNWGLALGLRIAAASLPGELTVSEQHGSLLGPIHLRGVHYRDAQIKLSIQQLDLDWRPLSLFSGELAVTNLALNEVDVALQATQSGQSTQPSALVLPLRLDVQNLSIAKLQITPAANASPLAIDQVQLSAHAAVRTITLRELVVAAYQARAKLSGDVSLAKDFPLHLAIEASYQDDAKHHLQSSGSLTGDLRKLQLTQNLSGMVQAKLKAEAKDILTHLQWQAQLDIASLDTHALITKGPAVNVQGKLSADGDLSTAHAESQLELDDRRIGLAHVHLEANSRLPLTEYTFTAKGDFIGVDLPEADVALQGKGDLQQVRISQLEIDTLKGKLQGNARVAWQPQLSMDAELALHQLDLATLSSEWPGQLSGELSLQTETVANNPQFHFMLRKVSGELRGYPLKAELDGRWADNLLELKKCQLGLAGATLTAQGKLAQTWDIHFQARSEHLNTLLPDVKGNVDLSGQLTGTPASPRLQLQGKAAQLDYADTTIDNVNLDVDLGLASRANAHIDLQALDVTSRGQHWHSVQLQTSGTNAAHVITLAAVNDKAALQARLHGAFSPWRWQGSLDQFDFKQANIGEWHLQQTVAIGLAQNQYQVSSLCLVHNGSHLCAQGQWDQTQRSVRIDSKALPLALLQPWLPQNIQLTGQLDIQGEVHATAQNHMQGSLTLSSPDKSVVVNFAELNEQVILGASRLKAELDDKGLRANLHLPLSEGGGIDNQFSLPGWSPLDGLPRSQAVQASLKLERVPAELVTRFIPDVGRAKGQLYADLSINGSLGEPRLHGSAKWQEGSMLVPQLGIQIRDVSAEIRSTQTNTLAFVLKAHSGDGDVQLTGTLRLAPEQGWPIEASLVSHNLEVSNIPEAHIIIDSKLKIAIQGVTINVAGDITVPQAQLRPHNIPEGVAQPSPDVIIVHGNEAAGNETRWLLSSHLNVQLGDDVRFNGFGIRGKLRGNLVIVDEPGKLVMGRGEVSIVDGIYRLRGQDLTIRRGRLIFSNTFIDDPALDVEAIRTIDTVTAGVRLKGTLKQPQLTVFSEPTMSESDALAYLIFGHSFSQSTAAEGQSVSNTASALGFVAGDYLAKGIGGRLGLDELRVDVNQTTQNTALVMGKYLSPKLYLRYYSGIAEASRIVQLQYQLSRHVQIQTESGYRGTQSITGGDIFFTIEY